MDNNGNNNYEYNNKNGMDIDTQQMYNNQQIIQQQQQQIQFLMQQQQMMQQQIANNQSMNYDKNYQKFNQQNYYQQNFEYQNYNQQSMKNRKKIINLYNTAKSFIKKNYKIVIIFLIIIVFITATFININNEKKPGAKNLDECIALFNESINDKSVKKAKKISFTRYIYQLVGYDNYDRLIEQENDNEDDIIQEYLCINYRDYYNLLSWAGEDKNLNCTNIEKKLLDYDRIKDIQDEIKYESGVDLKIQEAYVVELTYTGYSEVRCYIYCIKIQNRWYLEYGGWGTYRN